MIEQIFLSILDVSLVASIVVCFMLLLTRLLNQRYAARWKCRIWLLILLYLIFPTHFLIAQQVAPFTISIPDIVTVESEKSHADGALPYPGQMQPDLSHMEAPTVSTPRFTTTVSFAFLLSLLWLVGGFSYLAYQVVSYSLFRKRIFRWSTIPNEMTALLFSEIKKDMQIKQSLHIQISPQAHSPMLVGYFHTIVILPDKPYKECDLSLVLRHELTHYQRKDLWYKLLLMIAKTLHWFNPIVWAMSHVISVDLERSCDDEVLKGSPVSYRTAYSEMLLTAVSQQDVHYCGFTTNFKGSEKSMDERFHNIFDTHKKKTGIGILITAVVALLIIGSLLSFTFSANAKGQQSVKNDRAWGNAEFSLSDDGAPRVRYNEQDEWETLGAPIAAPKEWRSSAEIESRQQAKTLSYSPQTYMTMVSANDGWLSATYGNGVAHADTYIYRTHDGGKTWSETTQLEKAMWYPNHVLFLDDQNAIISIELFVDAPIFQTSDGGMTWAPVKLPFENGIWEAHGLRAEQDRVSLTVTNRSQGTSRVQSLYSSDCGKTWVL